MTNLVINSKGLRVLCLSSCKSMSVWNFGSLIINHVMYNSDVGDRYFRSAVGILGLTDKINLKPIHVYLTILDLTCHHRLLPAADRK